MALVKKEARQLVKRKPADATWDDQMYEIYVQQKVAQGQQAAVDGRLVPHREARERMARQ
jgi:hypothetical protein